MRGARPILDRVSVSLRRGEHAAIIGPNGSGKSTLIKLITGQVYASSPHPSEPPMRLLGRERWNLTELKTHLGIVSSDLQHRFVAGSSMGHVTGLEAVMASFFGTEILFLHHAVREEFRSRARAALQDVDAVSLCNRRMHEMSTGEVRRVLIARALVHRPEILVLDEPSAGLDLVAREELLRTLSTLAQVGTTMILVTHHVEEIIPEIRRVVVLRSGRVDADGPLDEVLTSETLTRVYGTAVTVIRQGRGYEMRLAGSGGIDPEIGQPERHTGTGVLPGPD